MNSKMKQCAFINSEGGRCRKKSAIKLRLFLNPELYDYPHWVEVNLCPVHFTHFSGNLRKGVISKMAKGKMKPKSAGKKPKAC